MPVLDPISNLPVVISLDGTEYAPVVQSGTTKRATTLQIASLLANDPDTGDPECYNATEHGLIGTGLVSNTDALNDLITLVNSVGGGKICFPEGNYLFNLPGYINMKSNVVLSGAGPGATIFTWGTGFAGTPNYVGILFSVVSNAGMENISIAAGGDTVGNNTQAITINISNNIFIKNVKLTNQGQFGIGMVGNTNVRITKCNFTRTNQTPTVFNAWCLDFSATSNGFISRNIKIIDNTITNGTFQTNDNFFDSWYCENWSSGASFGGHVGAGGANNKFIGNTFRDSYIGIDSASTIIGGIELYGEHHIVAENIIYDNASSGIKLIANDTAVSDNVVFDNSQYNNLEAGITLYSFLTLGRPDNCVIAGNRSGSTSQNYGLTLAQVDGTPILGVRIGANDFSGNSTGEINASGATTPVYNTYIDSTVTNLQVPAFSGTQGELQNSSISTIADGSVFISGDAANFGITLQNVHAGATAQWTLYSGASGGAAPGQFFLYDGTVIPLLIAPSTGNTVIRGTLASGIAGTSLGSLLLAGSSTGTVTIKPQAAAGTFNFNLPITAGTAGQFLTSAAGGSSPMTWSSGALPATPGTSGGIPYYNSTTTLASSALLTANQLVLGGGAATTPATLGSLGTTTTVLHGNAAGAPTFGAVSLTADVSGVLPGVNGGTGLSTAAIGDIIYASATTPTWSRLADVAVGSVLVSGGVGVAPAYSANPTVTSISPTTNDGGALGSASLQWSDLFLAEGGVINWDNGDVTLTQAGNVLTLAGVGNFGFTVNVGASDLFTQGINLTNTSAGTAAITVVGFTNNVANSGYVGLAGGGYTGVPIYQGRMVLGSNVSAAGTVVATENAADPVLLASGASTSTALQLLAGVFSPLTSDGNSLGSTTLQWSDLFLASGGVINWNNSNVTLTHSTNLVTLEAATASAQGVFTLRAPTPLATASAGGTSYMADTTSFAIDQGGRQVFAGKYNGAGSVAEFAAIAGLKANATDGNFEGYGAAYARVNGSGNWGAPVFIWSQTSDYLAPGANDSTALGSASLQWSDLFLAEGGVINWDNGDVTITQTGNVLAFAGASSGYTHDANVQVAHASAFTSPRGSDASVVAMLSFASATNTAVHRGGYGAGSPSSIVHQFQDVASVVLANIYPTGILETLGTVRPITNDAAALGTTALQWSDLFLAEGGVINWDNGDVTLTQTGDTVSLSGIDAFAISGSAANFGILIQNGGAGATAQWAIYSGASGGAAPGAFFVFDGTTSQLILTPGVAGTGWTFSSGGLAVGTFTNPGAGMIYTNSASFMIRTKTSYTNGAGAGGGTLLNAPAAGNPTKWIPVDDNGTTRYIPAW